MDLSQSLDVICQFNQDGSIIPIKIRLKDESGELQSYVIRGYMEYPPGSEYTLPAGISATNSIHVFKCKVLCFGREQILHMYFNANNSQWNLIANK